MYSSTLSLTLALYGVRGECHTPAALPPIKNRYPLYMRLGGPRGPSGWGAENLTPTVIWSLDRSAHSKSLYQLHYADPHVTEKYDVKISHTKKKIWIYCDGMNIKSSDPTLVLARNINYFKTDLHCFQNWDLLLIYRTSNTPTLVPQIANLCVPKSV